MVETKTYPYHLFKEDESHQYYQARYWNAGGNGICIVAVVTPNVDWAAYIGADNGWSEEACLKWAADLGAKLVVQDAKHFFPEIDLPYRN